MAAHSRSAGDASRVNRDLMLILNYNVATDVSACLRNCLIFRFRTKHLDCQMEASKIHQTTDGRN
jgi:hypothetical protein